MTHEGSALHERRIAIYVIAVVGLLTGDCFSSSQDASSTSPASSPVQVTYTPSPPPGFGDPVSAVHSGQLDPGTYDYLDMGGYGFNARFTVPAGWTWNGRYLGKGSVGLPDGAAIFFSGGPVNVYADPCHWAAVRSDPPTGPAVIDLMTALAAQPMRGAGTPIDRRANSLSVANGWPGMAIELTVPDDINFGDCDGGQFRSWGPGNNTRSNQGPGQRDLVWAVDGTDEGVKHGVIGAVIDAASYPGTPADVMSEIEAILGSVAVGEWG
jgi:hypothetical protein